MKRGFTLIEVLVTVVLVSIAIVGVLGGIRSIQAAGAQARSADLLQRLAAEQIGDMRLLSDPSTGGNSGDFSDRGHSEITWAANVETTNAANVDKVTVTATRGRISQAVSTLIFVRPSTGTASGGTPP
ncbi:MAG: type IV pilus modification PilV family protein [Janthinobacterium lividum]